MRIVKMSTWARGGRLPGNPPVPCRNLPDSDTAPQDSPGADGTALPQTLTVDSAEVVGSGYRISPPRPPRPGTNRAPAPPAARATSRGPPGTPCNALLGRSRTPSYRWRRENSHARTRRYPARSPRHPLPSCASSASRSQSALRGARCRGLSRSPQTGESCDGSPRDLPPSGRPGLAGIVQVRDLLQALGLVDELAVHMPNEEAHRDVEADIAHLPGFQGEGQLALHLGLGGDLVVSWGRVDVEEPIGDRLADYFSVQSNAGLDGGAKHRRSVEIDASNIRLGGTHRRRHLAELGARGRAGREQHRHNDGHDGTGADSHRQPPTAPSTVALPARRERRFVLPGDRIPPPLPGRRRCSLRGCARLRA